jgi:hypothetical protein
MNKTGFNYLFALVFLVAIAGLACSFGASTSAPAPTPTSGAGLPIQIPQKPTAASSGGSGGSGGSGWVTFTDQNDLYQIDLPGDWTYDQTTGEHYYADIFTSPDEAAKVENIVYNDGEPFTGGQHGKFALDILNQFYSSTGETGDIKVTGDQLMKDGSERLTWNSKGGDYSGYSFFEIRGSDRTTFLMFTVYWLDSAAEQYAETVDAIIASYRVP